MLGFVVKMHQFAHEKTRVHTRDPGLFGIPNVSGQGSFHASLRCGYCGHPNSELARGLPLSLLFLSFYCSLYCHTSSVVLSSSSPARLSLNVTV